jgi:signal transduction histidine kinase
MQSENTLRRRLITANLLLAIVIGGVFAAAAYVIIETLEYELIDVRLSRAADRLVESGRGGVGVPASGDLHFAVDKQIPAALDGLEPGRHERKLDGRTLHVLIVGQGAQRYAVIDDVTEFERLEFIAFTGLAVAFFAGVLLALAIARASASRVIAPLTDLAEAVQQDDLTAHPQFRSAPDEIGVLARAFEARTSRLKEALVRERLFTADVSHELRTPLTVVLGAAEVLSARLDGNAELQAVSERIRRTALEASTRVNALLQLAREPGHSDRRKLQLRALVSNEVERCRAMLEHKPVVLTFEAGDEVWVDAAADLAAIAVGNLLRNACHFTDKGSVRVVLAAGTLLIEDTGPGVSQALRERLFEPFARSEDGSSGGSGMGLSIVKRVAEHLGWSVRFDDAPHGGSRFTLSFASPQP